MNTKNITGIFRIIFIIQVKLVVFFHYLGELLKGNLSLKHFIPLLIRLNYFIGKLHDNKFVKIGKNTRLNLYIPGFSSKAFFTACDKFRIFDEKLPAATALISITKACRYKCKHCYQQKDGGKDIDIEKLAEITKKLQNMGIAFFNIEGGEPFLVYDKLKKICSVIDDRSEIWINSTGDGITLERLRELKKLNLTAIMFSLHSSDPTILNEFMGIDSAWENLEKAIGLCHEASIAIAFNICLGKDQFYNGEFDKVMERAKEFGASIIQLINPKPAGGWLESGVEEFTKNDIDYIKKLVHKYNHNSKYKKYPAISAQINEEDKSMFGCTAGGTDRFYINAAGEVQPCEFLNISFGNVNDEDFEAIYKRMRKIFEIPGDAWLCQKYSKDVYRVYKDNNLKSLPLDKELSKKIYSNWNRGSDTELYKRLR